ncbi:threonine/serine exporter family protein [Sporolituus thermophilus]|uniref:Uncharacterized membrane protein YjjB, DUF3815 family n=1 Tax=Sporolituus thermophilus DSM 23256 TaxID=1123285 RepID=A0A1G7IXU6_9FIRM|nr:threonine/serine exporter family protein [Sporolituus thermophilus]SDF17109.1 Uncharacterized membrane protein YjjB, DUF3815 family [Sporolituus thermophilus DSM 23256]
MVIKLAAVFLMGTAVGVLYRIPRHLLLYGSFTGAVVWLVYYVAIISGANVIFGAFVGSVAVGFLSEFLARLMKKPATIFAIPGFLPLVPGREAYTAMRYMVEGQYGQGVATAMHTMLTGGAIAFGIFLSATVYRLVINYRVANANAIDKG